MNLKLGCKLDVVIMCLQHSTAVLIVRDENALVFFFVALLWQVGAMRVMRTADDPPKCKGLALVRFLDRDVAKKAVEEMKTKKVRNLRGNALHSSLFQW